MLFALLINHVVPKGNRYKMGHMYTCPTQVEIKLEVQWVKLNIRGVAQMVRALGSTA